MSREEYIVEEKRIIEEAYKRTGISPMDWISKNAEFYHKRYAPEVTPIPDCGCMNKRRHKNDAFFNIKINKKRR